jgi:hypothetical protein
MNKIYTRKDEWNTLWSLALKSSIRVKNNMIDVCLNQGELTTTSKKMRESTNRVYNIWSCISGATKREATHPPAPERNPRLIIVRKGGAEYDARDALK